MKSVPQITVRPVELTAPEAVSNVATSGAVEQAIDSYHKVAMRIADERNALLAAARFAYQELDDVYDVDQPAGEAPKEYPFSGAGEVLRRLRAAIDKAEGRSSPPALIGCDGQEDVI